ncbi:nucleotide-diphospho-sugar transferase [Polychytrium aggregatum]|uniref:nucleotide-diphospho-sugar transferase n=1 Tax=Polychytrium aggregatum TaxID=110093 RepID=UPI0022FE66E5|nr:nucleotide-diphospho-sugar transferase [Polychytrium aggregatum]KAI9203268.1 nucleotide-diphospho-sugar transferase [Polychytrium aggregatum]
MSSEQSLLPSHPEGPPDPSAAPRRTPLHFVQQPHQSIPPPPGYLVPPVNSGAPALQSPGDKPLDVVSPTDSDLNAYGVRQKSLTRSNAARHNSVISSRTNASVRSNRSNFGQSVHGLAKEENAEHFDWNTLGRSSTHGASFSRGHASIRSGLDRQKTRKTEVWTIVKVTWTVLLCLALITPLIVSYALRIAIIPSRYVTLGLYGILVLVHYTAQLIFATLNRRWVRRLVEKRPSDWVGVSTGLLIVGYREDPELFRQCLRSVRELNYENLREIIVVVDGDNEDDRYMGQIFQEVFVHDDATLLYPGFAIADVDQNDPRIQELYADAQKAKGPICILQSHGGKRHAMYTGFQILMNALPVDSVVVTDSDTVLDPESVRELAFMLEDPKVGAATGDVQIWNDVNWLSFLTALRYWYAFNIERACQSFHRCVGCVSGPLGIYRTEVLKEIVEPWVTQTFLGVPCTYGDDRHLTNLTLKLGKRVVYTQYASCLTETPTKYIRWVVQQTRWSKSFYREGLFNLRWLHRHSPWMGYELMFQGIYPFVLLYIVLYTLYARTLFQLIVWANIVILMGFYKSIFALIRLGRGPLPALSLLRLSPRFKALLFLWDNGWGTSSRFGAALSRWQQAIFPILWFMIVLGGVSVNLWRFFTDSKQVFGLKDIIGLGVLGGLLLFWLVGYNIYQFHRRSQRVDASPSQSV